MEGETAKFCKKGRCSSHAYGNVKNTLKQKSFKINKNGNIIKMKNVSKYKTPEKERKKNFYPHKLILKNYDKNKVNDFIKNHKFKLRNDFDKRNAEEFLLSKEEAFNIPFCYSEEASSTTIKS